MESFRIVRYRNCPITAYAVDDATGALSRIGDIAASGGPVSIATTGGR